MPKQPKEDTTKEAKKSTKPTGQISFQAKFVKTEKNKDDADVLTVTVINPMEFLSEAVMNDDTLRDFVDDIACKRYVAKIIGPKGLLATYTKDEVLNEVSWDYVKQFFFDHINEAEILDHIGFEKIREHFKDKIVAPKESKSSPSNDINTAGSKSILEALNESEGQNP